MQETSNNKITSGQFYDIITKEEIGWQAIIYDLIKTEQLNPWDINIAVLADKYLLVIEQMEEANFFVSSKVLLACSLLLRLKSEILLNHQIVSLNELLYGKKPEKDYEIERIEIDEDELPALVPKTPIPRSRKVTLNELMSALNQAIETENRRIKKEIRKKQAEKSSLIVMPRANRIPLKERVKSIFSRIKLHLSKPGEVYMKYSELAPSREEKISSFIPVLHLANNKKVYLHQPVHFDEIYMALQMIQEEIEKLKQELVEENEIEEGNERG